MFRFTVEELSEQFPSWIIFKTRFKGDHFFDIQEEKDAMKSESKPPKPLGLAMRELTRCAWSSDLTNCEEIVPTALEIVSQIRGIKNAAEQYQQCKDVVKNRDTNKDQRLIYSYDEVLKLSNITYFWGSTQQLRFGYLLTEQLYRLKISSILLDPVFGSMLNPTGGVFGTPKFWTHTMVYFPNSPSGYNFVCKDVKSYLKNYHQVELDQNAKKYSGALSWYWINFWFKSKVQEVWL